MKHNRMLTTLFATVVLGLAAGWAISAQDKYAVKVPGGLSFSEFRGYESWPIVSLSENGGVFAATVANPVAIEAFRAGIPDNGKSFLDGAKLAKMHYQPKQLETFPSASVPGKQLNVDFMLKDSKRFADGGGWGYGFFEYDAASDTFRPADASSQPPQNDDAKCGVSCHTIAQSRDHVFTQYAHR